MNKKYLTFITIILLGSFGFSQEKLTKQQAINLALENNYGIKIARNNVQIAKNNASIFNSGYLPVINVNSSANYSKTNSEFTLQNGATNTTEGDVSKSLNASIGLSYTLFDGLGRVYNFKKLKETHNLSQLEAKTIIENTLLQLFTIYFEAAYLTDNTSNILKSLNISKERLKRAQYNFEYGQNTKLEVLNAEVDVNNDSILYINTKQQLANTKRDLNLLMGRKIATHFEIETNVTFNSLFKLSELISKSKQHNVEIEKVNNNIKISELDIKVNRAGFLPNLSFNGAYRHNRVENEGDYNFAKKILANGINANLSLNWNLFDGGTTKTRTQNAKINANNYAIEKEQIIEEIERNVTNALEIYNNALFVLKAEEINVETNKRNFQRTEEQFKLGQVTSIEFRQAQINLLNAQNSLNQAKYEAKYAELNLLQLSGDLLNTKF